MTQAPPHRAEGMKAHRPARQQRSREKQDRLLAAAAELIAEQGFDRLKLADVVARAGCSIGTLYYRFGDKEGLYRALRGQFLTAAYGAIDAMAANPRIDTEPLAAVINERITNTLALIEANGGILRAMLARSAASPEDWQDVRDLSAYMRAQLARKLAPRLAAAGHPQPEAAIGFAVQLINSTAGNALLNDPGPLRLGEPAFARELTRAVLAYLGLDQREAANR